MSENPGIPTVRRNENSAPAFRTVIRENARLRKEIARLRDDNSDLRSRLLKTTTSLSWRITAPLRLARYFLRGDLRGARTSFTAGARASWRKLPPSFRKKVGPRLARFGGLFRGIGNSSANQPALQAIVERRCGYAQKFVADPALPRTPTDWPAIDVSIVCFNSRKWLDGFIGSLTSQAYPLEKINLCFVDHGSDDGTVEALEAIREAQSGSFASIKVLQRPNLGFGAGHNAGIQAGTSAYCLVTNADLTFEKEALTRIVALAEADEGQVACWELRQKPYEHPKFYDPVTGETNWCSHACVLLRRSALAIAGGYDENIFMYGEDVELSYRLRQNGFRLRYCPEAVVWHFTYEHANQIKPLQYTGSIFANLYLRLKYGKWTDIAAISVLLMKLWKSPEIYPDSRLDVRRTLRRLAKLSPRILKQRRKSMAHFPFHQWDYDFARQGAFVAALEIPKTQPLVSVVTRTFRGRETYVVQAALSVMRQTYRNIEHIVVEDGGDTLQEVVEQVSKGSVIPIKYVSVGKVGRSAAGNAGLAAATGEFVVFLDDDDLLFADHVECLVQAVLSDPESAAAYSLAWEVPTDASSLSTGSYVEHSPIFHPAMQQSFDPEVLRQYNYFPIQAIMFRRELYTARGGFEVDLDALEDWNLWNRYAVDNRFLYVPKVTSFFRTPADPAVAEKRSQVLTAAYEPVFARTVEAVQELENSLEWKDNLPQA